MVHLFLPGSAASLTINAPRPAGRRRYWKIHVLDTSDRGTYNPLIKEIEMASSISGADLCTGGTALGSANRAESLPALAFDNNTGTWWQDNAYTDRWIGYDFGAGNAKTIEEIRAYCWGSYPERFPRLGYVASSNDGSAWTVEWYFGMNPPADGYVSIRRPTTDVDCRYWGIWIHNWLLKSTDVVSLIELELRETIGGADATSPGGAMVTSLLNATWPASNAIDNNSGTFIAGNNGFTVTLPTLVACDFGSGVTKTIREIAITARETPYHTQTPTGFWIIKSSDGINWRIAADITVGTAWTSSETKTFTV